jgi:hypothetical protein
MLNYIAFQQRAGRSPLFRNRRWPDATSTPPSRGAPTVAASAYIVVHCELASGNGQRRITEILPRAGSSPAA